nr:MAG TPA: hypothetical protein [Caudoviricetes sp.]
MHPCDKCKRYNKCYPRTMSRKQEEAQRQHVSDFGCRLFEELTVQEMFVKKEEH